MSLIEKTVGGIKKAVEPHAIKETAKRIAISGVGRVKQLHEQSVQRKQEAASEREKPRYYRQLNLKKTSDSGISRCVVNDVNGSLEYTVQSSFTKKRRYIYIYNRYRQLMASATEDKPLFSFWGNERKTVFSISIIGAASGTATPGTQRFHNKITLDPQKWSTNVTRKKCEVVGPIGEVLAETVGLIRKQTETTILFYNQSDELLALMVLLLQTALYPDAFNKEFERYYGKMVSRGTGEG